MKLSHFIASTHYLLKRGFDAAETMQWLTSNRAMYWSWGVSKRFTAGNKGLYLRVHGHHFNGYVLITLNWDDVYEVHFIKTNGTVVSSHENIYCDMLAEFIDDKIERIPEYTH